MYVRVVGFTGVTRERVEWRLERIDAADWPPPDVPMTGLQVLFDESYGTAVALQFYETAEDMQVGDQALGAMDPSETPGTRASVDMCELKLERRRSG